MTLEKGVKPRIGLQDRSVRQGNRSPFALAMIHRSTAASIIQPCQTSPGRHDDSLKYLLRHRRSSHSHAHALRRPERHDFFAEIAEGGANGLVHVEVLI